MSLIPRQIASLVNCISAVPTASSKSTKTLTIKELEGLDADRIDAAMRMMKPKQRRIMGES
jgi:hypothetical protein